jgi:membrane protein
MRKRLQEAGHIVAATFSEFLEDDCMSMAAALSFYTMFSLPPLLLIVVTLISTIFPFSREQVSAEAIDQINSMIGEQTGEQIMAMLQHANQTGPTPAATVLGMALARIDTTTSVQRHGNSVNRFYLLKGERGSRNTAINHPEGPVGQPTLGGAYRCDPVFGKGLLHEGEAG